MSKIYHAKAILFDMDGVITNTMADHVHAWKIAFEKVGIRIPKVAIYLREGQPGLQSLIELAEEYKIPLPLIKAKSILQEKEELFKAIARVRFISGAKSLVKALHREDFRLALVTGTSRHEIDRILPDHLLRLFEVVISGNDVKRGKPDPEPYLKALVGLCLKPADAVVIENAPFGIRSAKAAKLRCIAVETSLPREHLMQADVVVGSMSELIQQVKFVKP